MSSSSRLGKRKRYDDIKNMLMKELHKLTVDSGDLNNELLLATEDFVLMFKSMEDRQNQHLSRLLLLREKYREVTSILKEGTNATVGGGLSEAFEIPAAYQGNPRKFIEDSSTSLFGHAKGFAEQVEEMVKVFRNYGDVWKAKLKDLKVDVEKIMEERGKLSTELSDFARNI